MLGHQAPKRLYCLHTPVQSLVSRPVLCLALHWRMMLSVSILTTLYVYIMLYCNSSPMSHLGGKSLIFFYTNWYLIPYCGCVWHCCLWTDFYSLILLFKQCYIFLNSNIYSSCSTAHIITWIFSIRFVVFDFT